MTLRPLHAALLLVLVVFLGGVLGWWITQTALSAAPRVELSAKIQSLPPPERLPSISPTATNLDDHFVSPGGPVWVSLKTDGGSRVSAVCSFERLAGGGVDRPRCQRTQDLVPGARFAVGGVDPVLLVAKPTSERGAVAVAALTGEPVPTLLHDESVSVGAPKGTRLVRRFRAHNATLTPVGPAEGVFVGPHAAYAIIEPPPLRAAQDAREFLCATPTGYVQGHWQGKRLTVTFRANTEESQQVDTGVPALADASVSFACGTHLGSFTWLRGGKVGRVRCDPSGCSHEDAALGDIAADSVAIAQEVGQHTVLVYGREGVPMLRIGSFEELAHSASAPLFRRAGGGHPAKVKDLRFVATGTSLLVFVRAPTLRVVQIRENGLLEALAPQ
jgi:hypothetical protein